MANINNSKLTVDEILRIYSMICKTNVGMCQDFSIKNISPLQLRNHDAKIGMNFDEGGNYLDYDYIFFKMHREGMVTVRLYCFFEGLDITAGKELLGFLDKFAKKNEEFQSSVAGKSEYDLSMMSDEEFRRFYHLVENLEEKLWDTDEYFEARDVFIMEVWLDFVNFFNKTSEFILSTNSPTPSDIISAKEEIFEKLNKGGKTVSYPLERYFKERAITYRMLRHLEHVGKIDIEDLSIGSKKSNPFRGIPEIRFKILRNVSRFSPEFSVGTESEFAEANTKRKCDFLKGCLYVGDEKFSIMRKTRIESLLTVIFKLREKTGNTAFGFSELFDEYSIDPKLYPEITGKDFVYASIRDILKSKDEVIVKKLNLRKSFFGLSKKGISMQF